MAVPKRRVCHARKKLRTQHINRLTPPTLTVDRQTKSVHRRHHIDLRTGLYRGRQVLFQDEPKGPAPAAGGQAKAPATPTPGQA